ncbi:MAG: sugar ABC transporter permease [Chloroflexi bacterium]|nr:sugar ABC transporter permease [Chloroflexota bacterium]
MANQYRLDNILWALGTVAFIAITSILIGGIAKFLVKLRGFSETEQRKAFWGALFAGPWISGFFIFVAGPTLVSLYYSFTDYKLGEPIKWIGLDNYRVLLSGNGTYGERFKGAMFNSFYYGAIGVPLQIMTSLGMAMLLNREVKGIRIFRTIFYLPVILAGGPAVLLAWRYMFATNGGFVNVSLQRFADSFFLFDYMYRLLIYVVESLNGFYIGMAVQGDPIGPLKYTFPALLGLLLIGPLAFGEWNDGKRSRAFRTIEILGLVLVGILISRGLVSNPINPVWTYAFSLAAVGIMVLNAREQKWGIVRACQIVALTLLAISFVMTLKAADFDPSAGSKYLIALLIAAVPLLVPFFGEWSARTFKMMLIAAVVLGLIIFVLLIPGQLDGGRLGLIVKYMTLQSAIKHPQDQTYLEDVFPFDTISTLWFYGLILAVAALAGLLHERYPQQRKLFLYGAFAFFALLAISSFIDTRHFFQDFADIAKANGKPNYHFARFHQFTDEFPENRRVPFWLTNDLWSKPSLILITMWSSGAGMLIFLAALKGVPRVLYEAAEVDGANGMQKFFKITLPMISPALFYNIVIGVIASLQTFEMVFIIRTPETEKSLMSAAFFLYQRTFQQLEIGQGSAASWILVVIIVALTAMQFRFSKWVHYEA